MRDDRRFFVRNKKVSETIRAFFKCQAPLIIGMKAIVFNLLKVYYIVWEG